MQEAALFGAPFREDWRLRVARGMREEGEAAESAHLMLHRVRKPKHPEKPK